MFANIVVGDEINRASPKTQAALLECMEEQQVTVDGVTYGLEAPFMVLATQNPIDMEGTYPLPEAQRDRFTARISMGYPDRAAEIKMLDEHAALDPLDHAAAGGRRHRGARHDRRGARRSTSSDAVKAYAVDLADATRRSRRRSGWAHRPARPCNCCASAKAWAALEGREYVLPDDLQFLLRPVMGHRLLLTVGLAHRRGDRLRRAAPRGDHHPGAPGRARPPPGDGATTPAPLRGRRAPR